MLAGPLPLKAPPPDPAADGPATAHRPPQRPSERRRAQPTDVVRTVAPRRGASLRWAMVRRLMVRLRLSDPSRDRRWIWLIATGVLALLATIWLLVTVFSDTELPAPTKPAKTVPMDLLAPQGSTR